MATRRLTYFSRVPAASWDVTLEGLRTGPPPRTCHADVWTNLGALLIVRVVTRRDVV